MGIEMETAGYVLVDVKGDELAALYTRRATAAQGQVDKLEQQIVCLRKKIEGKQEDIAHDLDELAPMQHHHPHPMHSIGNGLQQIEGLRMSIATLTRHVEFARFMAEHVDKGRAYRLSTHEVSALLGIQTGYGMVGGPDATFGYIP